MLRMVIADDEPVIIRGIQKLISWERLGIEIVAAYEDGQSALNGILSLQPDIALMDISMPGKTGIEILKELKAMEIPTKVIFISGYQNFTYAKDAIHYGAVDYLLKPVIEEELLRTLEKCRMQIDGIPELPQADTPRPKTGGKIPFECLAEPPGYLTACVEILFGRESEAERQLIRFSVRSFLDKRLRVGDRGIVFEKDGVTAIILNGDDKAEGKHLLIQLAAEAERERRQRLGLAVGKVVSFMNELPEQYQACRNLLDYFYFAPYLPSLILDVEEPVFQAGMTPKSLHRLISAMIQDVVRQDHIRWNKDMEDLFRSACVLADGRREDACFYLCSSLSRLDTGFLAAGLPGGMLDTGAILQQSREKTSYQELTDYFRTFFTACEERVRAQKPDAEKPDIVKAQEYINAHYAENLTLEILAGEIHMNPYYFSAFFKKQAGKNFKDYLNEVRLKHAVALLLSSDKMAYEIAAEVGYRDSRAFSDAFQKYFGETPSNYKKRLKS